MLKLSRFEDIARKARNGPGFSDLMLSDDDPRVRGLLEARQGWGHRGVVQPACLI